MSQGLTHYHTKIKQYISDFVRNAMLQAGNAFLITYNGTAGDKTQLEIYAAINSGKVCLLYDSNWNQYA